MKLYIGIVDAFHLDFHVIEEEAQYIEDGQYYILPKEIFLDNSTSIEAPSLNQLEKICEFGDEDLSYERYFLISKDKDKVESFVKEYYDKYHNSIANQLSLLEKKGIIHSQYE